VNPLRDRILTPVRARWPWLLALAVVALIALGAVLRGPVAEWLWPEAEAERLRQQAEAALTRGHLSAEDGSGARELYEAAIAIDPDRAELRAGLGRVATAALAQARRALDDGRLHDAQRHLRLARALSAPRAQTEAVADALRRRQAAVAGLDTLLAAAETARAAGRLHGAADAALPLYARILALQPDHQRALEGRDDSVSLLLRDARAALARGDLAQGGAWIAAAAGYDPGHSELPDAQAALAQAAERVRRRADADLRSGRLARAADGYRAWRDSGVDNAGADAALAAVARAHAASARKAAADFEFERARDELAAAQALAPDAPELAEARAALQRAERAHARARAGMIDTTPNAAQRRKVRALLQQAAEAEARGDWLTPPGESAFDTLRAARALAPADPAVRNALARILPRARDCFENELRDNRLQRARVCLDARIALEDDTRALADARTRLAQRWIAIGEERLRAGELDAARNAHESARALDPRAEGLRAFAERLRAAGAVER
jgi:hypothetical protein